MDDEADFDRLCRAVYLAARAGAVDCTAAFDLATSWLEERRHHPDAVERAGLSDAEELAALSLECTEADSSRMAEVALRLLATYFAPGFDEEPGWLNVLEDAMRVVNRDVAATGLRPCRLRVHDGEVTRYGNAYVETWDGYTGVAQGVYPSSGADPVSALLAVADDAQDAVAHMLFAAWPVCPVHRMGVHPRAHEENVVWWCAGDGGHSVVAIGQWADLPTVLSQVTEIAVREWVKQSERGVGTQEDAGRPATTAVGLDVYRLRVIVARVS